MVNPTTCIPELLAATRAKLQDEPCNCGRELLELNGNPDALQAVASLLLEHSAATFAAYVRLASVVESSAGGQQSRPSLPMGRIGHKDRCLR